MVSDLANPFATGNSNTSDKAINNSQIQPIIIQKESKVIINLNWTAHTLSGIYYPFGNGNPSETDKTQEQLIELNKQCRISPDNCGTLIGKNEFVSNTIKDDGTPGFDIASRVTPEVERLLYGFLSNPILQQSAESCGDLFFNYSQAYSIFGSVIGETQPNEWWNPYNIDINKLLVINPQTGRKELNTISIHTLRHQLNTPSIFQGGTWWTNTQLSECLKKHNQLIFLQNHVNLSLDKLEQEYRL